MAMTTEKTATFFVVSKTEWDIVVSFSADCLEGPGGKLLIQNQIGQPWPSEQIKATQYGLKFCFQTC